MPRVRTTVDEAITLAGRVLVLTEGQIVLVREIDLPGRDVAASRVFLNTASC